MEKIKDILTTWLSKLIMTIDRSVDNVQIRYENEVE